MDSHGSVPIQNEPAPRRERLARSDAEDIYIRAGELEVFRQLARDGRTLDETLVQDWAFAVGPFARLRAEIVVDDLGKTRGAINNLWGSQEAYRAAVMSVFLNDQGLGLKDVTYPEPAASASFDAWIDALAAVEIERGPRHQMAPENRYGLRWAAWLGLVPYGIWSATIAAASVEEYAAGVKRYARDVLEPALDHFDARLAADTTVLDLAAAVSSIIEGCWLNAALTESDPVGRPGTITTALARAIRLAVRGATV